MDMITKYTVPITGYVTPETKDRMERISANNRHMRMSRIIDEAVRKYLPELEASFLPPAQEARSGKKKTAPISRRRGYTVSRFSGPSKT